MEERELFNVMIAKWVRLYCIVCEGFTFKSTLIQCLGLKLNGLFIPSWTLSSLTSLGSHFTDKYQIYQGQTGRTSSCQHKIRGLTVSS